MTSFKNTIPKLQKRLEDVEDLSDYLEEAKKRAEKAKTYVLLTERQAADLLAVEMSTLRSHRMQGKAPCFYKLGKTVRYNFLDIVDYIEKSRRTSTYE